MKTNRRSIISLLILAAFALPMLTFQTGCNTTANGGKTIDWKSLEPLFEIASYTGTKVYLLDNPDKKPLFVSACVVLDALIADPNINVAKFVSALQTLPIKELKDPKAAIVVESTIVLWNAYKDRIPIGVQEQAAVVRPLAVRVRNGMGVAVGLDPIVTPLADTRERMAASDAQLRSLK